MKVEIRGLCPEDIEALAELERRAFSMPWSKADFEDLLRHDYCFYLVALVEGTVAGCCGCTVSCGEASIDNVVVAEQYRGRGSRR